MWVGRPVVSWSRTRPVYGTARSGGRVAKADLSVAIPASQTACEQNTKCECILRLVKAKRLTRLTCMAGAVGLPVAAKP